jgi:hypothetical protein
MIEEVLLDREILNQIDTYEFDLASHDWDSDVPVEELSYEALALL